MTECTCRPLQGGEQSGRLQGTPLYMAPELVKDRRSEMLCLA